MAGADQHVLPGVEIILQVRETAALRPASVLRHRQSRPAALPPSPVEQDVDLRDVLELARQFLPQFLLVPRYDYEAACRISGRRPVRRVGLIGHALVLRTAALSR